MAKEEKKITKKDGKKKEQTKKVKSKKVKKENFLASVRKELKLVKWPEGKEIVKYTIATVIFCIILVIFFELLNVIMAYVKGLTF